MIHLRKLLDSEWLIDQSPRHIPKHLVLSFMWGHYHACAFSRQLVHKSKFKTPWTAYEKSFLCKQQSFSISALRAYPSTGLAQCKENISITQYDVVTSTSGGSKLGPVIWPRYAVQRIRFWQGPVDHNIDVQYQWRTLETKSACLCEPMASILCNSVVVVFVVVVRTRPRGIPLAIMTMRKSILEFHFPPIWVWGSAWQPLRPPELPC